MLRGRSTIFLPLAVTLLCMVYWASRAGYSTNSNLFPGLNILHQNEAGTLTYTPLGSDLWKSPASPESPFESNENAAVIPDNSALTEQEEQPPSDSKFPARFPRQIWQTSSSAGLEKYADKVETWKSIGGFKHHWLSDDDATSFVHSSFSHRPSIINLWDDLSTGNQIILRADFLRYLLMLSQGGVYSDIDTSVHKHPDVWIPIDLGAYEINAIIGIEYDDNTYAMFVRPISFCQWTLMSKPNHPIFAAAVDRVISNLEFLARRQRVNTTDLKLEKMDVLEATGPGMITDVVMQVIRDSIPGETINWSTFHNQMTAKLYGDVLILPINGFAGAQKHSHASNPDYGEIFVEHHFGRTWYGPQKSGEPSDKEKSKGKPKNNVNTKTPPIPLAVEEHASTTTNAASSTRVKADDGKPSKNVVEDFLASENAAETVPGEVNSMSEDLKD